MTQINRSIADDTAACERLLAALGALGALTSAASSPLAGQGPAPGTSPADGSIGQEMSEVVIAVQSHDRLIQQLTHVAESLRGLHDHLADPHSAASPESWRRLREKQLRAFSMTEERALFASIVGTGGEECKDLVGAIPAQTIELFDEPDPADGPLS